MFDISFGELMIIGAVALVVIGPEKLPRVARTAGHFLGRFQRYVAQVKSDIGREMELAELKRLQTGVEDAARDIEQTVRSGMHSAEEELRGAETELLKAEQEIRSATESSAPAVHMGMIRQSLPGAETAVPVEHAASSPDPIGAPQSDPQPATTPEFDEPRPQLELGLETDATHKPG